MALAKVPVTLSWLSLCAEEFRSRVRIETERRRAEEQALSAEMRRLLENVAGCGPAPVETAFSATCKGGQELWDAELGRHAGLFSEVVRSLAEARDAAEACEAERRRLEDENALLKSELAAAMAALHEQELAALARDSLLRKKQLLVASLRDDVRVCKTAYGSLELAYFKQIQLSTAKTMAHQFQEIRVRDLLREAAQSLRLPTPAQRQDLAASYEALAASMDAGDSRSWRKRPIPAADRAGFARWAVTYMHAKSAGLDQQTAKKKRRVLASSGCASLNALSGGTADK